MAIGRVEALYSLLARTWGPYLGEKAAWERAGNIAGGLQVVEDLDEARDYFVRSLHKVNMSGGSQLGQWHSAQLPHDLLERAAWAAVLALVDAGYSLPLDP